MKFVKDGKAYSTDYNGHYHDSEMEDDEKVLTLSIIVPKNFNGYYCERCPIWNDSIKCDIIGMCPLN